MFRKPSQKERFKALRENSDGSIFPIDVDDLSNCTPTGCPSFVRHRSPRALCRNPREHERSRRARRDDGRQRGSV